MPRRSPTTTSRSRRPYVIAADPPKDGQLYIVRVEPETWNAPALVVLSSGEELAAKWHKLAALAEQICQECVPVVVRTWQATDGMELVELYRAAHAPAPADDGPEVM